jgi:hypothetical protein
MRLELMRQVTIHLLLAIPIIYIKKELGNKSMNYYLDISMQLRKELEELPRDYTRQMATQNWDVLIDLILNFNIGRFLIFMDNYNKGIPDKIRITKFGVDGPATTSILYFDGNIVVYVIDGTRYPTNEFHTYYGYYITVNNRNYHYNQIIIDYNLVPLDGSRETTILSIWAGLEPQKR